MMMTLINSCFKSLFIVYQTDQKQSLFKKKVAIKITIYKVSTKNYTRSSLASALGKKNKDFVVPL